MSVYRFRIGNDARIIRAPSFEIAKRAARALFGPQIKQAIVTWFPNHVTPSLTGAHAYDTAVKTLDTANSARRQRAMQRGGVDYLRALYNPHDPAQVAARAEKKARAALAILATF